MKLQEWLNTLGVFFTLKQPASKVCRSRVTFFYIKILQNICFSVFFFLSLHRDYDVSEFLFHNINCKKGGYYETNLLFNYIYVGIIY